LLHWDGITPFDGIWTILMAFFGIGMLASGCSGWMLRRSTVMERAITIIGALAFVYPSRVGDVFGFVCFLIVLCMQKAFKRSDGKPLQAVA